MLRQYFKLGSTLNRYCFSTPPPLFSKKNLPNDSQTPTPRKFQKLANKQTESSTTETFKFPKENVQQLVNKINEANKFFLGIKYNTNYLKANRVIKYQQALQLKAEKATVSDIPLELSKAQADSQNSFQTYNQNAALSQKSAQIVFSRSRLEPTLLKIQQLYKNYIVKLSKKQRLQSIQPNFELQCIKTLKALEPRIVFKLQNEEATPMIKIKSITLFKGLSVYRNQNYSNDSFEKDESQLSDGIVSYKLYRQPKQQYPQVEWFSTKKINARFQILVKGGPSVQVLDSGTSIGSSEHVLHNIVVETNLLPPPPMCEHQLTPEQFYRLDYNSLIITNVDRKNQFYGLTFSQKEKTSILINKIE